MKNFLFLLSLLVFAGCTNQQSPDSEAARTTSDTTAADAAKTDTLPSGSETPPATNAGGPVDYFRAVGNEPGWILKLQKADNGSFPAVLVHNYGADTLTGIFPRKITDPLVTANHELFMSDLLLRGEKIPVQVLITRIRCIDDAGNEHPATVKLTVQENWHPGCGNFLGQ